MSKPKSKIESVKFQITTTPRVTQFLDLLIETEAYGITRSAVAENLIRESMREFLLTDKLDKLKKEL